MLTINTNDLECPCIAVQVDLIPLLNLHDV